METKILLIIGVLIISCNQKKVNSSSKGGPSISFNKEINRNDTIFIKMKLNYERYKLKYKGTLLGYAFKKEDTDKVMTKVLINYPISETDSKTRKVDYGRILYEYRCIACHGSKENLRISQMNSVVKKDAPVTVVINGSNFEYIRHNGHHWFVSNFSSIDLESLNLFLRE